MHYLTNGTVTEVMIHEDYVRKFRTLFVDTGTYKCLHHQESKMNAILFQLMRVGLLPIAHSRCPARISHFRWFLRVWLTICIGYPFT